MILYLSITARVSNRFVLFPRLVSVRDLVVVSALSHSTIAILEVLQRVTYNASSIDRLSHPMLAIYNLSVAESIRITII